MFGWYKFLAIYLGAGVIGNIISLLLGTAPQTLGSSGATYGLMGALGAFYFVNRNRLGGASAQGTVIVECVLVVCLYNCCCCEVSIRVNGSLLCLCS